MNNWNEEPDIERIETKLSDDLKEVVIIKPLKNGTKEKTTQKIKLVKTERRIKKSVLERKNWKKFGVAKGLPDGPEVGTTFLESVSFEFVDHKQKKKKKKASKETSSIVVTCRYCNAVGKHFTSKCPYKEQYQSPTPISGRNSDDNDSGDKFVVPGRRNNRDRDRNDKPTIRITNISEDMTDYELRDLFGECGPITRLFLAKDRETGRVKGFAFVTYEYPEDAQKAIDKFHGKGIKHLILNVEWAKNK
eukprot:TRINITY_DN3433_c1_g3_i4.p1 TRINITY_DN3433_c1_g3~~TRINITY_DN3433_c1_g3_i4.p1  ORF type:complete len:248 (+),score=85.40 TRINITY_DN3433_c1_g3_i4:43-786(+)